MRSRPSGAQKLGDAIQEGARGLAVGGGDEERIGVQRRSASASGGATRSILLKTSSLVMLEERELGQELLGGLDVLGLGRIGRVDDVEQQIGVRGLFERRAERGEQIVRQIADEADGVGDDDLALVEGTVSRRERVSSVAKSLSSASTSAPVSVLSSVLLPALV